MRRKAERPRELGVTPAASLEFVLQDLSNQLKHCAELGALGGRRPVTVALAYESCVRGDRGLALGASDVV